MKDKELRIKMGKAGKRNVIRFYGEPIMKMADLFTELKSRGKLRVLIFTRKPYNGAGQSSLQKLMRAMLNHGWEAG